MATDHSEDIMKLLNAAQSSARRSDVARTLDQWQRAVELGYRPSRARRRAIISDLKRATGTEPGTEFKEKLKGHP